MGEGDRGRDGDAVTLADRVRGLVASWRTQASLSSLVVEAQVFDKCAVDLDAIVAELDRAPAASPDAPTATPPTSWDDPRLAGDPNKGRTCMHCGGIVPAGARYKHGLDVCAAPKTTDGEVEALRALARRYLVHSDECGKPDGFQCNCGLDDAIAALDATRPGGSK